MITFFKILSFWLSIAFVIGGICIYRVKKRTGGKHGKRFLIWGIIIGMFLFFKVCCALSTYDMHGQAQEASDLIHSGNVDEVYVDREWIKDFPKTEDLYSYEKVEVINNNVYLTSFR